MGIDPVTLTIASSLIGLGGTVYGAIKSSAATKKATAAQNRALAFQQRADELKQARERRQIIREQRLKAGAAEQAGANQGATATSAIEGGVGSITSQADSNLSFLDSSGKLSQATTDANAAANKYSTQAKTYASVADFGATIFSSAGGFNSLFGSTKKAPVDSIFGYTPGINHTR